jgi:predicted transcriptional regulator
MTLKVTMTINQDYSEDLIGLLTKAFGRGELGIGDIKIERADPLDVGLKAIKRAAAAIEPSLTQLVVAKKMLAPKAKLKRSGYSLGMRAVKSGKHNGVTIILTALAHDASRDGIREMFKAHDINPAGVSPSLTKLQKRGYIVRIGAGVYRLTPKGQEFVKQWRAQHERADSE